MGISEKQKVKEEEMIYAPILLYKNHYYNIIPTETTRTFFF
jgi:hypothetical protein